MSAKQFVGTPFEENAQVFIKTTENYTMNNADDIVDVLSAPFEDITIKLPPQPLVGQHHRIMAPLRRIFLDGNGHAISGNVFIVPSFGASDLIFSSSLVWVNDR